MFSNNLTMMTDLYELTMMQGYFFEGNEDKVVFDVFYRKNPSGSAYAITCGYMANPCYPFIGKNSHNAS